MVRKLLYILSICCLFYFNLVNANINIEKDKTIIFDYSNNIKLEKLVTTGKLKLYLINNTGVELIHNKFDKNFYFKIKGPFYYKKGQIYLYLNKKVSIIDYNIKLKSKNKVFDISSKFKFKRIQDRPLSCESSAAADIISYFKQRNINEYDIYNLMDKDFDSLPVTKGDKIIWGNPDKGFVGKINYYGKTDEIKPSQSKMTGYGVYEKPLKKVYDKYFIKTSIINLDNHNEAFGPKDHLKLILSNLKKGNMVQLWGDWCTKPDYDDGTINSQEFTQIDANSLKSAKNECWNMDRDRTLTWYYNENGILKQHKGLAGEHAFYLLGYEGDINNPLKIIVWDTYTGYHKYDTIEWMRKWKAMNYRSIIAYKPEDNYLAYIGL